MENRDTNRGTGGFRERDGWLRSELGALADPQERWSWVVDRARRRAPFPAGQRTSDRLVPGCAARLWLAAEFSGARCRFACDSDSAILKAAAGLVCELYDDLPPAEVLAHEPAALAELGLLSQLTENRRRTIARVREAVRDFARAHSRIGAG